MFTRLLAQEHPQAEITGVDISHRALLRARERTADAPARTRLVQADIATLALACRFDLVFCAETLYYVGRRARLRHVSARLTGLLAPAGVLVMVHPWPEAERLHRFVDSDPAVSRIARYVHDGGHRPFTVAVYQAREDLRGAAPVPPSRAFLGHSGSQGDLRDPTERCRRA